jgi:hypothetical protein
MSCENTVCPVYMSHPSDRFGVAIRQKKIQVDKKKKHVQLSVNICFLTREFSINRTLLILHYFIVSIFISNPQICFTMMLRTCRCRQ